MVEELTSLYQRDTWVLVPLSLGKQAIGSLLVYKIKIHSNGSIERYKSRVVVKGHS